MAGSIMTVTVAAIAFVLAVSGQVAAATIYGTIQASKQPVGNAPVSLACPGETKPGTTDARGTYRLTVGRPGQRCTFQVRGASAPVILYEEPTRYDFELAGGGAQPRLIRR